MILKEGLYAGEFLLSEAGTRSREVRNIGPSQTLKPGSVLGRIDLGALSGVAAAEAGNTGNGTVSAVTVAAGTPAGVYQVGFIEPGTNAGAFRVEGPDGVEIGDGVVAVAFSAGGLGFTISDGSTDFVANDGFAITVTAAAATNAGCYVQVNETATDGSQVAREICWDHVVTGVGQTAEALTIARDAEVKTALLGYRVGASSPTKAAHVAELAARGIIARA